jgi:F-type H+-transporting ATPase subunit a
MTDALSGFAAAARGAGRPVRAVLAALVAAALVAAAPAAWAAEAPEQGGEEHGFLLLQQIPGLEHAPFQVVHAIFVALVVAALAWIGTAGIRSGRAGLVPSARLDAQNIVELIVQTVIGFLDSVIGHEGRRFLPLIGTLAFFILFSNLLGLVPGFLPPTSHYGTTATLAVVVFLVYNYVGIRAHGASYVKHFLGPVWWIAPLLLVIEVFSHLVRPVSLSIRLYANMFADHQVVSVFLSLVPLVVPVFLMALGLLIAFIQTLVFCLLSAIYIAGAVAHEEH